MTAPKKKTISWEVIDTATYTACGATAKDVVRELAAYIRANDTCASLSVWYVGRDDAEYEGLVTVE